MKHSTRSGASTAALLAIALALTSCGEPPRRAPAATGGTSGAGATSGAAADAPSATSVPIVYSGEVVLRGALADAGAPAAVYVSLKPRDGQFVNMPILSRRFALDESNARVVGATERLVPFRLTGMDSMAGGPELLSNSLPPEVDIDVLFDPSGGLADPTAFVRRRAPMTGPTAEGLRIELGGS